ncbi:MAG: cytochrome c3 family protein [Candidatus Zixiibacteriota bacterium]
MMVALALLAIPHSTALGQSVDDCMMCHEDPGLTKMRNGRMVNLGIDQATLKQSVHAGLECITCHADLEGSDFPHKETLEPVDCGVCHDDVAAEQAASLHGQLAGEGEELAPRCWTCHGSHDVRPVASPESRVAKFRIPYVCGECHKEGTPVTQRYDIPQDSILTHYSESIHGEGLFHRGLTVTAVCTDCHTAHSILPHTDPKSSIFRENVARTCEKCHGLIEQVHRKVIRGELWEKEPNRVPVCVDCHAPHKARNIYYEQGMADRDCMRCHTNPDLETVRNGETISLYVDSTETHGSIHRNVACAQCHTGASPAEERSCATITTRVDCSVCHAEVVQTYSTSTHGTLAERGDPVAPMCRDCHGVHGTKARRDPESSTFPTNVPDLCGNCHREGNRAAVRYTGEQRNILANYTMSIHGKGLLESGLVVTAMCTDCHTAHHELPKKNPESSVNRDNIAETCARCHKGIYEEFERSIHSPLVSETTDTLPVCSECHSAHTITRTDVEGFKLDIMNKCGRCHEDVTSTYFDTFHGKVSKLGYAGAAKCYDCHGAHDILPTYTPASHLSRQNIVKTCGKCHEGSHRQFAGYLTHATHHDRDKYPILFYTFWFMTALLVGTLTVAGVHTALWMPRSFQAMRQHKKLEVASHGKEVKRFSRRQRQLHILVIISFLGLALTGMTLKFSYLGWAQWLAHLLGGYESAGFVHRVCAVITFFYFGAHLVDVFKRRRASGKSWRGYLFDSNSMLPNRNDLREFVATTKWFIGLGPRPEYGRWTYWEKFDYFAVFWGVIVIGSTGLMLWFPEFFTRVLPGWIINVATIIHSDEALLATGFIFTVHFFNTHFRPDKFPMDTVIFTGRVPLEEFKKDRPREYAEMIERQELEKHLVDPLPHVVVRGMKIFGFIALSIGLILVVLIIWAQIFGYR